MDDGKITKKNIGAPFPDNTFDFIKFDKTTYGFNYFYFDKQI
jgi:hypothetical protein